MVGVKATVRGDYRYSPNLKFSEGALLVSVLGGVDVHFWCWSSGPATAGPATAGPVTVVA